MKKSKKSQMEIMGLAIIIILLFLGMVFVIKFVVLKAPKEYKKDYAHTELASNVVAAMLYTTSRDCSMVSFAKLFQDCAEEGSEGTIGCGDDSSGSPWKSCAYAQANVESILGSTLGELKLDYHFRVSGTEIEVGEECPGSRKHQTFPLPGSRTIFAEIDICG